jgi:hypothetical protein
MAAFGHPADRDPVYNTIHRAKQVDDHLVRRDQPGGFGFLLTQKYLPQWATITIAIIAGILGLLIAWFILDWGLMIFSSLAGSALVVSGILTFVPNLGRLDIIIFIVLFVIGLGFQIFNWSREHHEETETTVVREGVVVVDEDEIHDDDVYDNDDLT